MTSLDLAEIEQVKLYLVKCSKCKLTIMIGPDDRVCPVCKSSLPKSEKR